MLFILVNVYLLADYCNCLENVNATTTTGLKVYLSQVKLLSFEMLLITFILTQLLK
jgi:hypothetical protein